MVFGVFRGGCRLETAFSRPNIQVSHGIHDTATKLAKLRLAANGTLFFQRARR